MTTILCFAQVFCFAPVLCFAPAPFPKDRPHYDAVGTWATESGSLRVTFHKNGKYEESWYKMVFVGHWSRIDGDRVSVVSRGVGNYNRIVYHLTFRRDGNTLRLDQYGAILWKR